MSRRVHACTTCPGKTRHKGRCSECRRAPKVRAWFLSDLKDPFFPSLEEMRRAMPLPGIERIDWGRPIVTAPRSFGRTGRAG